MHEHFWRWMAAVIGALVALPLVYVAALVTHLPLPLGLVAMLGWIAGPVFLVVACWQARRQRNWRRRSVFVLAASSALAWLPLTFLVAQFLEWPGSGQWSGLSFLLSVIFPSGGIAAGLAGGFAWFLSWFVPQRGG